MDEIDVKPKISKWRAHYERQKLNNELNKLHVYDPSMAHWDLVRNLQIVDEHKDQLGTLDGL